MTHAKTVVTAFGILVGAWLMADMSSSVIASVFEVSELPAPSAAVHAEPAPAPYPTIIAERNLFNSIVTTEIDNLDACMMDIQLRATLPVVNRPDQSMAVLMINHQRTVFQVGDDLPPEHAVTLHRVERGLVHLQTGEHICALRVSPGGQLPAHRAPIAVRQGRGWQLDRARVKNMIESLPEMLTQVKAVPYWKDGRLVGYRVAWIQPGSVLGELGVKKNDVIQRINGIDVGGDIQELLRLLKQVDTIREITVDIERNKSPKTLHYWVQ